jgi:hypothetical protein
MSTTCILNMQWYAGSPHPCLGAAAPWPRLGVAALRVEATRPPQPAGPASVRAPTGGRNMLSYEERLVVVQLILFFTCLWCMCCLSLLPKSDQHKDKHGVTKRNIIYLPPFGFGFEMMWIITGFRSYFWLVGGVRNDGACMSAWHTGQWSVPYVHCISETGRCLVFSVGRSDQSVACLFN